jgi:hypothetical protein
LPAVRSFAMLFAMFARRLLACLTIMSSLLACGSPTHPDPRCDDVTGLHASCTPYGGGLQCLAITNTYCGPGDDVSAQTTWTSSAPEIVTVTPTGSAQSVSPGDAQLHASYRGLQTVVNVKVIAGQPPLPTFEIDAAVLAGPACRVTGHGVPGVLVTVTAGLNAGASATTDENGSFALPDMVDGPITLRASKTGYQDVAVSGGVGHEGIPKLCISPNLR